MEMWMEIEDWPDYEISNYGRIKNKLGLIMKQDLSKSGYPRFRFTYKNKRKTIKTHKLVANAFIGKCPIGRECNHKDGNKLNNWWRNLEYVTHQENVRHSYKMGLKKSNLIDWWRKRKILSDNILSISLTN